MLLSRSILRPIEDLRGGDRADPPGPLRRARTGHHRRRVRRALLGLQPDGRRARRARAAARGLRHLPRRGGGRATSSARTTTPRATRSRSRCSSATCRTSPGTRPAPRPPEVVVAAERAVRVRRPDHRPPPRPRGPVRRRRPARRLGRARAHRTTTPTAPCSARSRSPARSTAAGPAASRSGSASTPAASSPGSIGGAGRLSFSVIGDAVNLARAWRRRRARPATPC